MKTQFDTEKEAETALNNTRKKSLGWCPAINDICRENCICYYEGSISHKPAQQFRKFPGPEEYWLVHYPGCTHVLICGVITVES